FEELLFEVDQINKNGFKIGRNTLRGRKDADYHYKQVTSIINSIVDADANLLAESVDTSIQSAEEIEEIHNRNEIQQENLGVTGIEAIDSEMIGMFKGEMIVIQGGSGSGKSRLATALGKQILNNGKNVLFISLEQKANRIFSMFHSRHILEVQGVNRITDKDLIRQSYSPLDEHIVKSAREDLVENQNIGRLRIEGKYVKAKDIMMELETIWEDFKFDAVVLDYFGLLGTEKDRYNELTDAINLLKSACKS
ncbi:DnaB-like helicase C-terminal domain-containing protein, partial [Sutterella wadsworthensis]|uniref:DnaB-like helicase C-terminal domain-containing protein n=1 Tax=Sutterella wadsworthensis TaxID=40545 RepID=UPI0032BFC70D